MTPHDNRSPEDERADILTLFDEALAAGVPLPVPGSEGTKGASASSLAEDLECLQLLNQLRPRCRGTLSPTARATLFGEVAEETSPPDPRLGTKLGKYRIVGRLGKGGMGVVYEAEDPLLQRKIAIKMLPESVSSDPQALRRFLSEARAAARLNHPNVVSIYEVDQQGDAYYIVMELVQGGSLQDLLEIEGFISWQEATRMIADACRGLVAAHAAGLVHRDIKPLNLMCSHDGAVKLVDFGLAKAIHSSATPLTKDGMVVGTPEYMSPEQCRSEPLDHRTDLYSLGAAYYTLLVGEPPYPEETPLQVMFAHCDKPIPDPRQRIPDIPAACVAIIQRAMAKQPIDRFGTASQMLWALEELLAMAGAESETPLRPGAVSATDPTKREKAIAAKPPKKRVLPGSLVAGILSVMLLVAGGLYFLSPANRGPTGRAESIEAPSTKDDGKPIDGLSAPNWETRIDAPVLALAYSPDGKWLAVAADDVLVWPYNNGKCTDPPRIVPWKGQAVRSLAFSSDSKVLVGAGKSGPEPSIKLWHLADGPLPTLDAGEGDGRAVDFSPDGKKLAAGIQRGDKALVKVWNWQPTGALKSIDLTGHTKAFSALTFSPDSKQLFSGGHDAVVKIWDLKTGNCQRDMPTSSLGGVTGLAFCNFDKQLAVDTTTSIEVYTSDDWMQADLWKLNYAVAGNDLNLAPVNSVAVGGEWAAHGGNKEVLLFNVSANKPYPFQAHTGAVNCVAISPDTRFLATGGADKSVRLWDTSRVSRK
jgi:serine/threonine protein kinase/WD40 repeat protein